MRAHILTITLNPTVDFSTTAPDVVPEIKLRCSEPRFDPGGGGINVARAIRLLGGQAVALIAIGGQTGAEALQRLASEGVPTVAFQGPGETRQSVSVIDQSSGAPIPLRDARPIVDRGGRHPRAVLDRPGHRRGHPRGAVGQPAAGGWRRISPRSCRTMSPADRRG